MNIGNGLGSVQVIQENLHSMVDKIYIFFIRIFNYIKLIITNLIMIRKFLFKVIKPAPHLNWHKNTLYFSTSQNKLKQTQKSSQSEPIKQNKEAVDQVQQKIKRQSDPQHQQDFVYEKENRNTVGWWIYRFFVWGTIGIFSHQIYLTATHNKKTPVQNEPTAIPLFISAAKSIYSQYNQISSFFWNPPVKKFLPDPLHPTIQNKTLVLNLTGTLLKTDFVFGKGLTLKRRPGLNTFLKKLSQKYELVIFTDDDYMFVTTAVQYLDPRQQVFMGAFGRQSMVLSEGHYTKDLKYLNRDPRNIIVIDKDLKNINKYPENAIILKQFDGDDNDTQLIKLLPLLESLSNPQVRDVRKVLAKLGQNPHDKFYQKLKQKQNKMTKRTGGVMGFFGNKSSQTSNQTGK